MKNTLKCLFLMFLLIGLMPTQLHAQQNGDRNLWGNLVPRTSGNLEVAYRGQRYLDSNFVEGSGFISGPLSIKPLGWFFQARGTNQYFDLNGGFAYMTIDRDSSQFELGAGGGASYYRIRDSTALFKTLTTTCAYRHLTATDFCEVIRNDPALFTYLKYDSKDVVIDIQVRASFVNDQTYYGYNFYDYNFQSFSGNYWYKVRILLPVLGRANDGTSLGITFERRLGGGLMAQMITKPMQFTAVAALDDEGPMQLTQNIDPQKEPPKVIRFKFQVGIGLIFW